MVDFTDKKCALQFARHSNSENPQPSQRSQYFARAVYRTPNETALFLVSCHFPQTEVLSHFPQPKPGCTHYLYDTDRRQGSNLNFRPKGRRLFHLVDKRILTFNWTPSDVLLRQSVWGLVWHCRWLVLHFAWRVKSRVFSSLNLITLHTTCQYQTAKHLTLGTHFSALPNKLHCCRSNFCFPVVGAYVWSFRTCLLIQAAVLYLPLHTL